jgi:hypothetical protein
MNQLTADSAGDEGERLASIIRKIADTKGESRPVNDKLIPELLRIAGRTLLSLRRSEPRFRESEWQWLSGISPDALTREDANKFLCACILEYQAGKVDVWDNTAYFCRDILEEPADLWRAILSHSSVGWADQFFEYELHPEPLVHARLRDVASFMVRYYCGDARQIWDGYYDNPDEVFRRLLVLNIPRSTACLVIGALKDEGYLKGPFDIVGDVVDSRVIARIACGEYSGITSYQARMLARMICSQDPWILDRPLYVLGMSFCSPGPRCRICPARSGCVYAVSNSLGVNIGTVVYESLFGRKTVQKSLKNWL